MKHLRLVCLGVLVAMCAVCVGATALYRSAHATVQYDSYAQPLAAAPREEAPLADIDPESFLVSSSFESHLPLVVLDTGGVEPPVNTYRKPGEARFIPIEGLDPYVLGELLVYNSASGSNSLSQAPESTSRIRIKRRGNTSMLYAKPQWLVKTITASGQNNDINLLSMGEEHEWVLNGSMADKSMLRNYLAFRTASRFLPYTPDSRYCEVLVKTPQGYRYEGVFLLCESIRQGPHRVDIETYQSSAHFNSYLVRRDRLDEQENTLTTYAQQEGLAAEHFALLYPNKTTASEKTTQAVQDDLNRIEQILYSPDDNVFSRYPDVIDVDSFVDYFLLNEFFTSYDAGNYSTYAYKDVSGKLCMGPVWDFDGTMDNYLNEPLEPDTLAFQVKPWFAQLCTDVQFVRKLEQRYAELQRGVFSEETILTEIDAIIAHLGGAQQREWLRWNEWYTQEAERLTALRPFVQEDGTTLFRDAKTHPQEIYRIKTALREHGRQIPRLLTALHKLTTRDTGLSTWMGVLLALALCTLLLPAAFVAYRK